MSKKFFQISLLTTVFSALMVGGCAVEAAKVRDAEKRESAKNTESKVSVDSSTQPTKGATIEITENSPADTVRVFYKKLRENRFRDAMFLTNLRPAIEGLTDAELADLQLDLAKIAQQIPSDIEINGEIISGNYATVTARLPDNETQKIGLQEIKLRKEGDYWIVLTVDEKAESAVKKDGNQYFFNLRLETHEAEAKAMLGRISKAQMIYSLQNEGSFGEMSALIEKGFLPADIMTSDSTGYNYTLVVSPDKKKYYATAEPAVYGKTGKKSFLLDLDDKQTPRLNVKETKNQTVKK